MNQANQPCTVTPAIREIFRLVLPPFSMVTSEVDQTKYSRINNETEMPPGLNRYCRGARAACRMENAVLAGDTETMHLSRPKNFLADYRILSGASNTRENVFRPLKLNKQFRKDTREVPGTDLSWLASHLGASQ